MTIEGRKRRGVPGLVIVVLRKDGDQMLPDAFGTYIGPHEPIEIPEGMSWRDAVADETARANALEEALASLGYDVAYYDDVAEVAAYDEVQTLTVNGEPWDLRDE